MGVDIGAIAGFIADKDEIEWDFEYMKLNFNQDEKVKGFYKDITYGELITIMENNEIEDFEEVVNALGLEYAGGYDEWYVYVPYKTIQEEYSHEKIMDMKWLAEMYLESKGIKNPDIFIEDVIAYYW